jgi:hypothetical protein
VIDIILLVVVLLIDYFILRKSKFYLITSVILFSLLYRQQSQIPITVLLMFTDIGQEVQHANELLNRLNQWKKWWQVNSLKKYIK